MNYVVTNAQMKKAEALCDEKHLSYSALMRNAGNACASRVLSLISPEMSAVVLCGRGNNGGDGFVAARRLLENGVNVKVILACGKPRSEIAAEYFSRLPFELIYDYETEEAACLELLTRDKTAVIDCVFGTGFHGELPEKIKALFALANKAALKISVDVPSGADSDAGAISDGCFTPDYTLVLAAMKKGLINPKCADITGITELFDIGIKEEFFEQYEGVLSDFDEKKIFPKRVPSANKGTFGRLLNIAGSVCYSGAAALSTKAALKTGTGLCTLAAPISVVKSLSASIYETTYLPLPETEDGFISPDCAEKIADILPKMNAVSIGCGLGNSKNTRALTEFVIKNAACPIIIDADGINSLAENINILKERTGAGRKTVLTPHPLELSRVTGRSPDEINADRIKAAGEFSREYGVILLLKGAFTVIANGDDIFVNPTGNAALAKGGSGDVLTGIIASMTAQGIEPFKAAAAGAFFHGKAADILAAKQPARTVLPSDIINAL